MVRTGLRIATIGFVAVWFVVGIPALYESAALNHMSLATTRWFLANKVSVRDLGLRLEYDERLDAGLLAASTSIAGCKVLNPRLALRTGTVQMLLGDLNTATGCFSTTLAMAPDATDALILSMSAHHLAGQTIESRSAFERLPKTAQGIASIAALAIFDYLPVTTSDQTTFRPEQLGNIVPRQVLFDLMFYRPEIAWRFLDRAVQVGILSATDRSDLASLEGWQSRNKTQHGTVSQPSVRSATDDQRDMRELRRSVAVSTGCAEDSVELGFNLLPDGLFDQSHDLDAWRVLPWTSGGGNFNLGEFMSGLDVPDGGSGVSALRISGLWKNDDPNRYAASGSLELVRPLNLLSGKNLYLMLARYKTENIRSGQTDIWFDSADYRRFVGVWRLPPSDGMWQILYALGYVDGDVTPTAHPLISYSALGTVWMDYLKVMPVNLSGCSPDEKAMVFGKLSSR